MTFEEKIAALRTEEWIDLGDDHYLEPKARSGVLRGYSIYYRARPGMFIGCDDLRAGFINLDPETSQCVWTVERDDPLTISPSVLDPACGDHGWIRDGRWVKA
jgi:hypothetical protein